MLNLLTFEKSWREDKAIIYENESAIVLLSYKPVLPGQLLIVSKSGATSLEEIESSKFLEAAKEGFKELIKIYKNDTDKIVTFYQNLKGKFEEGETILKHKYLKEAPVAYNIGINNGKAAGQIAKPVHAHLFPRRGEKNTGVVTAMKGAR